MRRILRGLLIAAGVTLLLPALLADGIAKLFWFFILGLDRLYTMLEE